jgi:hypothetical protein
VLFHQRGAGLVLGSGVFPILDLDEVGFILLMLADISRWCWLVSEKGGGSGG